MGVKLGCHNERGTQTRGFSEQNAREDIWT